MKTKILLWSVVSVLTVGIAVTAWAKPGDAVAFPALGEPQVIHLDDHTKLTLLGTSYGYHHMAPGYENLGTANWIYTAPNTTVVWIEAEHKPDEWPNYELLVSDRENTACVNIEKSSGSHVKAGVDIQGFRLNAFPRWDKETILRVRPYGGDVSKEQFVISNRVTASFTNWIPKPLPDKQSDGDLEVTLNQLIAGAPVPYREGGSRAPTNDPANQCVRLHFDVRQNGRSATNWNAWPVQITDAAGNWSRGLIYGYPTNGVYPSNPLKGELDGYYYQPGLWPEEAAWKVRLEFSRTSGFSADEVWCVTNIPVQPGSQQDVDNDWVAEMSTTNSVFAETTIAGIHLKLFRGLQYSADSDGQKHITVLVKADPFPQTKGIKLSVLKATDEQNRELDFDWGGTTVNYPFEPTWVHDAKSLNLTIAVQKLRFVEFTVKPARQ
jgi:hypothetical protein